MHWQRLRGIHITIHYIINEHLCQRLRKPLPGRGSRLANWSGDIDLHYELNNGFIPCYYYTISALNCWVALSYTLGILSIPLYRLYTSLQSTVTHSVVVFTVSI